MATARKVLVADDEESVRLAMRRLFSSAFGCEVVEAADGLAALNMLAAHEDLSLAVLDVGMPVMSGLELLGVIRDSPAHADLPVVFFSGSNQEDVLREAIQAGASDFMLKPFRLAQIRPRIEQILSQPRAVTKRPAVGAPHTGPVLVVDGSADTRHFVSSTLAMEHTVITCATGHDALQQCLAARPFVVLVGTETGLLHGEFLGRKIRDTGCGESVLLRMPDDGEVDPPSDVWDATVPRTFVPATFMDAFRVSCEKRFSLTADLPAFGIVKKTAMTAAKQALGMLAHTDVTVAVLKDSVRTVGDVVASVTLTMWKGTAAVDIELRCSPDTARSTAASLLGIDEASAAPEDACSAVGELINIVAGRIQVAVAGEYGPARFTLPKISLDEKPSTERVQLALRATASASSATFDLLMRARAVKLRAAA